MVLQVRSSKMTLGANARVAHISVPAGLGSPLLLLGESMSKFSFSGWLSAPRKRGSNLPMAPEIPGVGKLILKFSHRDSTF